MAESGMEMLAALDAKERAELFAETSAQKGMVPAAIEKDFWVCWALNRIFSDETLSQQVLFKGGTSLSKCYGLIARFSEDIDLILDWTLLTDEDPYAERSNTQQDKFNKEMSAKAEEYIAKTMLPKLQALFEGYALELKEGQPKSILLTYPKAFDVNYIKPEIELELGPMSAMTPNDIYTIRPYCADLELEKLGDLSVKVKAIRAIKTFWDKVTILHCEAHRPEDKTQPPRYSRHFYDLYQMLGSDVAEEAKQNKALLTEVFKFKHQFYPQSFANYPQGIDGAVSLIPPDFRLKALADDYRQMQEMIFGDYPAWDDIIAKLRAFEEELAS